MLNFNLQRRIKEGHKIALFRDGEEFFPRLYDLIDQAQKEVLLETFILEEDEVGKPLKQHLLAAAKRGVKILLTVDSWGSFYLPQEYIDELVAEGVKVQIYDPQPSWAKGRPKLVHRLHRKLAVIDGQWAFVGGINLCKDHLTEDNPAGKRDYVAEVIGPVVKNIRELCLEYTTKEFRNFFVPFSQLVNKEEEEKHKHDLHFNSKVAFVVRDNWRHRTDIEKAYLEKIKSAKKNIYIANAYIFPSYRLTRALRKAAKRGVNVKVVTQGKPDLPYTLIAAHSIYKKLVLDGVEMYEFLGRPLHGKIAAIDDEWSTIGSSNLDPWSLGSNLEANLVIENGAVNNQIRHYVEALIKESKRINMEWIKHRPILGVVRDTVLYHLMRWWPTLIKVIPNERPVIQGISNPSTGNGDDQKDAGQKTNAVDQAPRQQAKRHAPIKEKNNTEEHTTEDEYQASLTAGAEQ